LKKVKKLKNIQTPQLLTGWGVFVYDANVPHTHTEKEAKMPRNNRKPEDTLSRGEAIWVYDWLVDVKHIPPPKRGFYAIFKRTPSEISQEYNVPILDILQAARRQSSGVGAK